MNPPPKLTHHVDLGPVQIAGETANLKVSIDVGLLAAELARSVLGRAKIRGTLLITGEEITLTRCNGGLFCVLTPVPDEGGTKP